MWLYGAEKVVGMQTMRERKRRDAKKNKDEGRQNDQVDAEKRGEMLERKMVMDGCRVRKR